jgi:cell division protein FtsW (lipid II flippase)
MRTSRAITWARLRVYFGALLLVLFALGGLLVYASSLADQQAGHGRSDLRTVGAELIALSVVAAVFAAVRKRRLSRDE